MKNRRGFLKFTASLPILGLFTKPGKLFALPPSGIVQPVTTRSYNNLRTGTNLNETTFTQANVKASGIKKYFTLPMEGDRVGSEAQMVMLPSVPMCDGHIRDVAISCSMNDTIWAYDANISDDLWMTKIGIPANGNGSIDMYAINDHWGIISTPVLDPDTNMLYCVALLSDDGVPQHGTHAVFAVDITNGKIVSKTSLANLTVGSQRYDATMRKQRSSLTLATIGGQKTVFFCSGSVLETSQGASGWIIAYDVATASISAYLPLSQHYFGAGTWMGGQGMSVDPDGYLWAVTGNGGFDGITDFGECIIKVKYAPPAGSTKGLLTVVGYWAPYTDAGRLGQDPTAPIPTEDRKGPKLAGISAPTSEGMPVNRMKTPDLANARVAGRVTYIQPKTNTVGFDDEDLGSAGLTVIPEQRSVLACGKDGISYVVNMDNPGNTLPTDFKNAAANYAKLNQPPQWYTYYPGNINTMPQDPSQLDFLFDNKTHHMHSTSVRYLSSIHGMMLFCGGENGNVRAWSITKTSMTYLACSAELASPNAPVPAGGMPGWNMCLSANGDKPGTAVLWAVAPIGDANKTVTNGRLLCYDPENFGTYPDGSKQLMVLWDSQAWGINFLFNKFNPPVVSGGKLFLPTYNDGFDVYGLA